MTRTSVSTLLTLIVAALVAGPSYLSAQSDHTHGDQGASCDAAADCAIEEYLLSIMRTHGVARAMSSLDSIAARDEDIRRDGHGFAHAIGINAFTSADEVGAVFAECTPAFQSGCYHGVIQAYFTDYQRVHGSHLEPTAVNDLCRAHREAGADRWLLFQCAHGMGHGMVMIAGNHLPSALGGCDLVADSWERESCYGGVFMENIVHETVPHHATGRPQAAHDAHAGHAQPAQQTAVEPFPPLKADDPLYPCNALDERYLVACYQMQTSAILHFNGSDVSETADVCASAPEPMRPVCFQSLGRDISSITLQDHSRAMRLCSLAPSAYQPWCTIGYTKNLVDVTADPADGFAYCRLLPPGESKRVCNVAVGEQIWVLAEDPARRESMCGAAEPEYIAACRHGAGIGDAAAAVEPRATAVAARRG